MSVEEEIVRALSRHNDVMHLIVPGINVNAVDRDNTSLLMHAMTEYNYTAARALLTLGADPNIARRDDMISPLMMLCWRAGSDEMELMQQLLDCGADVNAIDADGWTPLMYCSAHRYSEMVYKLIDYGTDLHKVDHRIITDDGIGEDAKKHYDLSLHDFLRKLAEDRSDLKHLLDTVDSYVNSKNALRAIEYNVTGYRNRVAL